MASKVRELLFGGAKGGGKSQGIVMAPLMHVSHPKFNALLLRQHASDLGPLWDMCSEHYPRFGGRVIGGRGSSFMCRFKSGALISYAHCGHDSDVGNYAGDGFSFIGYDELVQFTHARYVKINAQLRSAVPGLPSKIRCTSNPPDVGEGEWVKEHWGAWLDRDFRAKGLTPRDGKPPLDPCRVAWVCKDSDRQDVYLDPAVAEDWNSDPERQRDHNYALSRSFIPSLASDNAALMQSTPDYLRTLADLPAYRYAQLALGSWDAKPAEGDYFRRHWFEYVDQVPAEAIRVRYWDLAATVKNKDNDPDHTAGVRIARTRDDTVFVEDVITMRGAPGEVTGAMVKTASQDGPGVLCMTSIDPGGAGVFAFAAIEEQFRKTFGPGRLDGYKETGTKEVRARPLSAWAHAGHVKIVRGDWNKHYMAELEAFPMGPHDDQVDASSNGFNFVCTGRSGGGVTPPVRTDTSGAYG